MLFIDRESMPLFTNDTFKHYFHPFTKPEELLKGEMGLYIPELEMNILVVTDGFICSHNRDGSDRLVKLPPNHLEVILHIITDENVDAIRAYCENGADEMFAF